MCVRWLYWYVVFVVSVRCALRLVQATGRFLGFGLLFAFLFLPYIVTACRRVHIELVGFSALVYGQSESCPQSIPSDENIIKVYV